MSEWTTNWTTGAEWIGVAMTRETLHEMDLTSAWGASPLRAQGASLPNQCNGQEILHFLQIFEVKISKTKGCVAKFYFFALP